MLIGRIFRTSLVYIVILATMCVGALGIGNAHPTTHILAQTYMYDRDSQSLLILDVHRNLPIKLDFPVPVLGNITVSQDGRRLLLPTGTFHQPYFTLWEVESGRIVNLPHIYKTCSARNWRWLSDNRHVLFECRDNPQNASIGGLYIVDFETDAVYQLFREPTVFTTYHWSPDTRRIAINDDGQVHVMNIDGTGYMNITPKGRRFDAIGWRSDGEVLFLRGVRSVEQYTFATGKLELLLDNFASTHSPALSPDGEWIALISNERRPRAFAFHIASQQLYLLETRDIKINPVDWVGWSPDSQWVVILTLLNTRDKNRYYLARPDASVVMELGNNLEAPPIWASDNVRIAYEIYDTLGPTYYSEVVVWDLASFLPPQTIMRDTHSPQWSPNGDGLAFIYYPQWQRLVYQNRAGERRFLTDEHISVLGFTFVRWSSE